MISHLYHDQSYIPYLLLLSISINRQLSLHHNYIGKIVNQSINFKRGVPFTEEEDEIIKKRVLDWGDKGSGLWVNLQKELNRPSSNIIYRWNNKLNNQDKNHQMFKQSKWKVKEVMMMMGGL